MGRPPQAPARRCACREERFDGTGIRLDDAETVLLEALGRAGRGGLPDAVQKAATRALFRLIELAGARRSLLYNGLAFSEHSARPVCGFSACKKEALMSAKHSHTHVMPTDSRDLFRLKKEFDALDDVCERTFFDAFADAFTPPEHLQPVRPDYGFMARVRDGLHIREYFRRAIAELGLEQIETPDESPCPSEYPAKPESAH